MKTPAGIGPAGNRRRARRIGTDSGQGRASVACDPRRQRAIDGPGRHQKTRFAGRRGSVGNHVLRFRGGDDARAHCRRQPDRTFACVACRLFDKACSRRSNRLLGRNLITVFSTVNTFARTLVRGQAGGMRRRADAPACGSSSPLGERNRTVHDSNEKSLVLSPLWTSASGACKCRASRSHACDNRRLASVRQARAVHRRFDRAPFFAPHHVELRKLFRVASTSSPRIRGRFRMHRKARTEPAAHGGRWREQRVIAASINPRPATPGSRPGRAVP